MFVKNQDGTVQKDAAALHKSLELAGDLQDHRNNDDDDEELRREV